MTDAEYGRQQLNAVHCFAEPNGPSVFTGLPLRYGFAGLGMAPPPATVLPTQVHGRGISNGAARHPDAACTPADGLYLYGASGSIGVRTADCLPVLLAAPRQSLVMALHAGWRGLSSGIVHEGLGLAKALGVSGKDIYAVLGPAISRERFEVGPEVAAAFQSSAFGLSSHQLASALQKGREDRWHVDLSQCALFVLLNAGVAPSQISVLHSCTYDHPDLWMSYRREGKATPSIISWIAQG